MATINLSMLKYRDTVYCIEKALPIRG